MGKIKSNSVVFPSITSSIDIIMKMKATRLPTKDKQPSAFGFQEKGKKIKTMEKHRPYNSNREEKKKKKNKGNPS